MSSKKKTLLLFFLAALMGNLAAQDHHWSASFTPAIILTNSPHYGIQAGLGYTISNKLEILTEFALSAGSKDPTTGNEKYFRVKPELRYLWMGIKDSRYYTGIQLSYSFRKWEDTAGGIYFENRFYEDTVTGYNSAIVKSPVFTLSPQFGRLVRINDKMFIDLFLGLGIRVIHTSYSDADITGKQPYWRPVDKILLTPDPAHWVNGTVVRPHFNTGFRLFLRF
jgi:hypothetical protein